VTVEPTATSTPELPKTIEVVGDEAFVAWTERALALIEGSAPDAYMEVLASIDTIEAVAAGAGVSIEERRYLVSEAVVHPAGYEEAEQLLWYAGALVHHAHHSAQAIRGDPHTGKEAEIESLTSQLAAMQQMTDDPFFASYLQGLISGADDPQNPYWAQPDRHW
jgi:hypothetical protein